MKNRPNILAFILITGTLVLASYTIKKTAGSHPGSTGAPGDATCAQSGCHSDAQVVQDTLGINTLIFSAPDSSYVPGQTYTLTLKVNSPQTTKFGFELGALKNVNNTNAGIFNLLEPVRTQTISHTINNDLRYSFTHEASGTASLSAGYTEWKMQWTAPSTNQGNITFYYATNCTNNDGLESGDKIYLSSFVIKPVNTNTNNTTFIEDVQLENKVKVFFDRDTKEITLDYLLNNSSTTKIIVYDCLGATIYEGASSVSVGDQHEEIALQTNYAKGAYLVKLAVNNKIISKKILVE
ncbi:choice-of-anchor V domain-containing protein [Aurantibacillus circumpalustris]|uniref:choice-of-anchor V domain-containing protein n=1 Tax=Aurantibacillus circumpalustris TaxID=3036359 RepID=UPI00295AE0E5|nr:choice-of-anchor V domain-containing protein [Aurantibacillus circumpalustris]